MENQPCEVYIEVDDDYGEGSLPDGLHVEGRRRCPRNLTPAQFRRVVPDGVNPCPLYDRKNCLRAFSEELHCPKSRERRDKRNRGLFE
jgi:hypothetical protein